MIGSSGSPQFDQLRRGFLADAALRQELEWAFRLAVETYNPSNRGLRFITGGIGEWIITLAAYRTGLVTLPDGHDADGHDTLDLLAEVRELWSVKTSYKRSGKFTITNGQGGPGAGLVVPTIFLSPDLPGIVYVSPRAHPSMVDRVEFGKDSSKLGKDVVRDHAKRHLECVIEFDMPENPGAAVVDPALEAVRLLIDNLNFPRLRLLFQEARERKDVTVVTQVKELKKMREDGTLDEAQYQSLMDQLTGVKYDRPQPRA
ncbi:MAG TPA: hypothetical protein VHM65_06725 [Candidatus Lustribacter sp.]|nr:hypothetical protein [Candidatus Lustribacter sp.]